MEVGLAFRLGFSCCAVLIAVRSNLWRTLPQPLLDVCAGWDGIRLCDGPLGVLMGVQRGRKPHAPFFPPPHSTITTNPFSLLMEDPRRTLSSKSWMRWPAFRPSASVTWVRNALGEGGVGATELLVGPHPTVSHFAGPVVRQTGTQDAKGLFPGLRGQLGRHTG